MITPFALSAIGPGDRVWIGYMDYHRIGLRPVSKVTPTQIVIDWNGNGGCLVRFRRSDGYQIGGSRFHWNKITGVADAKECAAWDRLQQVKAAAEKDRLKELERRVKKQRELERLFDWLIPDGCVTVEIHDKSVTLTISDLTEAKVRSIAERAATP